MKTERKETDFCIITKKKRKKIYVFYIKKAGNEKLHRINQSLNHVSSKMSLTTKIKPILS